MSKYSYLLKKWWFWARYIIFSYFILQLLGNNILGGTSFLNIRDSKSC